MPADFNHYTPKQANQTAINAIEACATALDERFGEGYAKNNPQLVIAMVQSAALDMFGQSVVAASMTLAQAIECHADALSSRATMDDAMDDV